MATHSRLTFTQYMRNQGLSAATIKKYAEQTPDSLDVQRVLHNMFGTYNMYAISDPYRLEDAASRIKSETFDIIGHGMYSAGVRKYAKYLRDSR